MGQKYYHAIQDARFVISIALTSAINVEKGFGWMIIPVDIALGDVESAKMENPAKSAKLASFWRMKAFAKLALKIVPIALGTMFVMNAIQDILLMRGLYARKNSLTNV